MRVKYLQSVLRKDINFFDTEARDENIIFHISSDAILVQDAIGDKVYTRRGKVLLSFDLSFLSEIPPQVGYFHKWALGLK